MSNVVQFNKNEKIINEYRFNERMIRAKDMSKIFIGISQATYEQWAKHGFINRYKIGGSVFYKLSEIEKLIENSKEVI